MNIEVRDRFDGQISGMSARNVPSSEAERKRERERDLFKNITLFSPYTGEGGRGTKREVGKTRA